MARVQGIPDYPFITLPHPLGSLTREEVKERGTRCQCEDRSAEDRRFLSGRLDWYRFQSSRLRYVQ